MYVAGFFSTIYPPFVFCNFILSNFIYHRWRKGWSSSLPSQGLMYKTLNRTGEGKKN